MAPKKKPEGDLKDQRIPIMMSEAELKAIDDWGFANRIRSRGEAIRRLCTMGLSIDAAVQPILTLSAEIFRRRVEDGRRYRMYRYDDMPVPVIAAQAKLDVNTAVLNSLQDHARLVLALHSLAEPLFGLRENPELEEATKAAKALGPKLKEMADDIEELKLDNDDDPDWLKEKMRAARAGDGNEG